MFSACLLSLSHALIISIVKGLVFADEATLYLLHHGQRQFIQLPQKHNHFTHIFAVIIIRLFNSFKYLRSHFSSAHSLLSDKAHVVGRHERESTSVMVSKMLKLLHSVLIWAFAFVGRILHCFYSTLFYNLIANRGYIDY